jgi:acyl homoserine lactone synthase
MMEVDPMIIFVEPHERATHTAVLNQYFLLRKKIFCDQLRWVLPKTDDMECDDFDNEFNVYVLHVEEDTGRLTGGVRLMPTTGPTLMHTVWADMLPDKDDFRSPTIWEATRFCVDPSASSRRSSLANKATLSLTLAVIDFAQTNGISHIIAVCESKFFDMTNAYSGEAEIIQRKIDSNGVDICCGLWAANADRSRLAWARQFIGANPPEVVRKVA